MAYREKRPTRWVRILRDCGPPISGRYKSEPGESVNRQGVVCAGSKARTDLCVGARRSDGTSALTTADGFADAKAGLVKLRLGSSGGPTEDGSDLTVFVAVDIVKQES